MLKKLLFLLLLSCCFLLEAVNRPAASQKIFDYIFDHLEACGTLTQDKQGAVYVDLSDDYITKLSPFLLGEGFKAPPYLGGANGYGAHISVISPKEAVLYKIGPIPEAGNIVYFNIKDCAIVQPENQGKGKVCILEVEAPNLDKLRKKYGLGKRFHPYHITIGIQDK